MAETVPHPLQLWDGRPAALAATAPASARLDAQTLAESLARQEIFQPRGRLQIEGEPFTLPWFLGIERRRFGRHGRWIPRMLEVHKHAGESILAIGGNLGTDWVQYARHGADVQIVPPSPTCAQAMRQHFEERNLRPRLIIPGECGLPIENASIDILILNHVENPAPGLENLAREAYRVLRPGGKLILLCRAWWDIDAWWGWIPWYGRLGPRSVIDPPGHTRLSARQLRQIFTSFTEQRVSRRHLRRAEVPHLCRLLPLPLLERMYGRVMIFKAFKPVSAALPVSLAA